MKELLITLIVTISSSLSSYSQCNSFQDSLKLIEFNQIMNGHEWNNKWDFNTPMTSWFGVDLIYENGNYCVGSIDLYDNNLSGEIYDLHLPKLEELVIGNDSIYGQLPDFDLQNLKYLDISDCFIDGALPSFSNCEQLRFLSLQNLPDVVGVLQNFDLPYLEELRFRNLGINSAIPDFSNLPELRIIFIQYCENLTGDLPNFSSISLLENLQVFSCSLSGQIPDFNNLPVLKHIELSFNQLEGQVTPLSNCPELRTYSIAENNLVGPLPKFPMLPELRTFSIKGNNINDTIHDFSQNLKLRNLFLGNSGLKGNFPNILSPDLELIWASENDFTGAVPSFNVDSGLKLDFRQNSFDSISLMKNLSEFQIHRNLVTFDDILNVSSPAYFFLYSPMDSIPLKISIDESVEGDYILNINKDNAVDNNTYHWFIDHQEVGITNTNKLNLTGLTFNSESIWTVEWVNTEFENFKLISREFQIDGAFSTSTNNTELVDCQLFPNPSTGNFSAKYKHTKALELKVFDESGKFIYSDNFINSIDLSFLTPGNYIFQIIDHDKRKVHQGTYTISP